MHNCPGVWYKTSEPLVKMKALTSDLSGCPGSIKGWAQLPGGYPRSSAFPAWTLGLCVPVSPYHSLSQGRLPLALENSLASSLLRPTSNTRGQGSCLQTMLFSVFPMASYGLLPDPDLRGSLWPLMASLSPKPVWLLLPPAGINPASLRGTNTGVWVGVSGSEASEALSRDPETLLGYSMVGCQRAMMANRLSFFFDFKGGWAAQPWARAQLHECIHLDNPLGLPYSWGNAEWGTQGPSGVRGVRCGTASALVHRTKHCPGHSLLLQLAGTTECLPGHP
jgi:hypothetical protein